MLDLGFATVPADGLSPTDGGKAIVRPDDFEVGGDAFEGVVRDRFYLGEQVRVRVELSDGTVVTVDVDDHDRGVGEVLAMDLDTEDLHVIE